jgi:hypothetical protein
MASARLRSRIADFFRRRLGELTRRATALPLTAAIVSGVLAGLVAPPVDATHPAGHLGAFLGAVAAFSGAIFLGLAFMQVTSSRRTHRVLRFIRLSTLLLVGLGIAASLLGLISSLPARVYRYLFAVSVGGLLDGLVAALFVAAALIAEQRDTARSERLKELRRHSGSSSRQDERGGRP